MGSESPFPAVRWVRQEDDGGCGAAVLAMLTGRSYPEARDLIDGMWDTPKDWTKGGGANEFDLDRALAHDGFFQQRRYDSWRDKGTTARLAFPGPFAPLHYAMVLQPSNNYHFVVMLHNGAVLDPMREGCYSLSDWPKITQVVGLYRVEALEVALDMIADNRCGESWSAGVAVSALAAVREQPMPAIGKAAQ